MSKMSTPITSWIVQADLYKPSGKWYAGGRVRLPVNPWDSYEAILNAFWLVQEIVSSAVRPESSQFWTIVLDDVPESKADPNYHARWKRVLQVGVDAG